MNTMDALLEPIRSDFSLFEEQLHNEIRSQVSIVNDISDYLIKHPGKRLRPMLSLLMARGLNYMGNEHIQIAIILELIHTATLLHDDVMDNAHERRGRPAANQKWNNMLSVLTGDFLYARAFFQMTQLTHSATILPLVAHSTLTLAEGEVLQLTESFTPYLKESTYLKIIDHKTATLFALSTELSARLLPDCPYINTAQIFGKNLGMAFQIMDDLLDYGLGNIDLGKELGQDLSEGKNTLPMIYALARSTPSERALLETALTGQSLVDLKQVREIMCACGAYQAAYRCCADYVAKAKQSLDQLPQNAYTTPLYSLCDELLNRIEIEY